MGILYSLFTHFLCFKGSRTCLSMYKSFSTSSSHIFCILKWSAFTSSSTAFSHISRVLKRSEEHINKSGFVCMASLHASCVLRRWENSVIQLVMFIWLEAWVRSKYTIRRWFAYQIIFKIDYLISCSINVF